MCYESSFSLHRIGNGLLLGAAVCATCEPLLKTSPGMPLTDRLRYEVLSQAVAAAQFIHKIGEGFWLYTVLPKLQTQGAAT